MVALAFLLLLSALVLGLQKTIVVEANFKPPPLPAIHITASGDISNSSDLIRIGDVYTFTGNWTTYVLEVERSNIAIDGKGFFIHGNGYENGIILHSVHNVSISNVNIVDTSKGIYLENSSDVEIKGCSMTGGNHGIYLSSSRNNEITGNRIYFSYNGIYLDHSGGNFLRSNNIQASVSADAIYGLEFMTTGDTLADYVNDVDESNLINGKPIIYWVGRQDAQVPSGESYVALVNCRAITVQNQQISKTQGILVAWTTNSTITNNFLREDVYGVHVLYSTNVTVSWNQISSSNDFDSFGGDGVYLANSQFVTVANNQVSGNRDGGVTCANSSRNTLTGNVIARNWKNGINLVGGSDYNLIAVNQLDDHSGQSRGAIYIEDSRNNYLIANNLTDNGCWGIQLIGDQGNNTFYGNNFVNNSWRNTRSSLTPGALQISTPGTTNGNSWDNGSFGNYWSDYGGSDMNRDGVGDSPFYFNPTNQDNYPLMNLVATSKVPLATPILPGNVDLGPKLPGDVDSTNPEDKGGLFPVLLAAISVFLLVAVVAAGVYVKKRDVPRAERTVP